MSGFEDYAAQAAEIERELQRKGIVLRIDWDDATQVRLLASTALDGKPPVPVDYAHYNPEQDARDELFGLAHLMLQVMRESAEVDRHTHGGPVWKAFARALWAEHEARQAIAQVGAGETATGDNSARG